MSHLYIVYESTFVYECVCACVRACVRACVCACQRHTQTYTNTHKHAALHWYTSHHRCATNQTGPTRRAIQQHHHLRWAKENAFEPDDVRDQDVRGQRLPRLRRSVRVRLRETTRQNVRCVSDEARRIAPAAPPRSDRRHQVLFRGKLRQGETSDFFYRFFYFISLNILSVVSFYIII